MPFSLYLMCKQVHPGEAQRQLKIQTDCSQTTSCFRLQIQPPLMSFPATVWSYAPGEKRRCTSFYEASGQID